MNDILLCVGAAGIFFGAIILRGIFGYLKNKKIAIEDLKFDWKKFLSGSIKPILLTLAIGGLAALILAFLSLVDASGLEVQGAEQISIKTLLVGLFIADIGAIGYAMSEALLVFGLSEKQIAQIRQTLIDADIDDETGVVIDLDGDDIITRAINIKHDDGDGKVKTEEEVKAQNGAWPYYKVDVSTPDAFVNAVNGKGFDEGFGMQCVAGFKEFQYSLCGRILACAGGGANGYANQGADLAAMGFTRYADRNLQNGDWVIWGTGQYGHVAMYYNGKFFGQNQGASNPNVGCPFNLMGLSLNGYLCHYRPNIYKGDTPAPSGKKSNEEIANEVIRGDWGNDPERTQRLTVAGYDAAAIQAIVNQKLAGNIPTPSGSDSAKIGDRVITTSQRDQNGTPLNLAIINDGNSVWTENNGRDMAVLRANGIVRCAVPPHSLRKV